MASASNSTCRTYMHRSASELWSRRLRPVLFSRLWLKTWLKRIYHISTICDIAFRGIMLQAKGVRLGTLSILSDLILIGSYSRLEIGNYCTIGRAFIHAHDRIKIGHCVIINDGVSLLTGSHSIDDPDFRFIKAPISIGDYAWICSGASILPGVSIGHGAVVAAFSVVTKDIPPFAVAAGNPAKIVKWRKKNEFRYKPSFLRAALEAWVG